MGLNIGIVGAEQLFRSIDGKRFAVVHEPTATVVTLARVAFGIFVRQHRPLCRQNAGTRVVFRGDEFDMFLLTTALTGDYGSNFWVESFQCRPGIEHQCRTPSRVWLKVRDDTRSARSDKGLDDPGPCPGDVPAVVTTATGPD